MSTPYGIIYKARLLLDDRVYIGQTTKTLEERKSTHHRTAKSEADTYFARALIKYGYSNFEWSMIDEAYSKEDLDKKEIYWIETYNSLDPVNGFNTKQGGSYGKHTEQTKQTISEGKIAEKNPMFGKPSWNKGKKLSNEHKEKIKTKFKKGQVPWNKGKKGTYRTKPQTKEVKEAISKKNSGENNGQSKLTWEIVREIRKKYADGGITLKELGQQYNVSGDHLSLIVRNLRWREND